MIYDFMRGRTGVLEQLPTLALQGDERLRTQHVDGVAMGDFRGLDAGIELRVDFLSLGDAWPGAASSFHTERCGNDEPHMLE